MTQLRTMQRKAWRALGRTFAPIRPEKLRAVLEALIQGEPRILFVHSSFSSCGRFTAGAENVLDLLREYCGTLAFPTHTYCYPDSPGRAGPLFDPEKTPSQNGLLTELFRLQAGVVRSVHATHSMAASGPLAREIARHHHLNDTPCGAGTPYRRLVERQASVLMFGVTFHCYTLYHTAEDASGSEYAYEPHTVDRLRVVDESGQPRDCLSRRQSRVPRRFEEAGELLERAGLVRRLALGRGALLYARDCSKVHDFLVERLRKIPDFLYRTCPASLE